ncbi:hypothetical protein CcaverHIS002_0312350 [Cutaneotrichosporon cavernicola]|uniref:DUF567-domain-containing protein n=1 Tax=Cutaneotrichosporon cavernicola TaxID=279322 RepID=A0AA48L389_9TREE|nr:uncharacterized protein CcaverHIS019_0312220 [Cutaneotrichosporon cavernicola]BEI83367.1 hypothetical protein CcaverHIS002_0312350 [Cutaneotrichosporon cavernicola]BEI91152.1 hypothetical protein CcaverHIS019_0312220 [Cutaneotrichosporon cavernicola]BEI98929.1 hypothetical protein CcaverHIS631_0312280 [Cutaneotrichosporon cavernicola]BEJ06703.1 hypothetical protein CcaverHIS641_0312250 [Cutaneotrichosporon cavernicola]
MLPNTLTAFLQVLPKLSKPLGSGNYAAAEMTLVMKRGAMSSSADTIIMDMDSVPRLLLVRRRSLYGQDRRDVTDAKGAVLYSLAENHLTFGRGIVGSDRGRAVRLGVKRMWAASTSAKVITAKVEHNGVPHSLLLQGSMDSATVILEDGSPVARIRTYCNGFSAPRGSVCLTIAPGVDIGLAAALALCFDECSWC